MKKGSWLVTLSVGLALTALVHAQSARTTVSGKTDVQTPAGEAQKPTLYYFDHFDDSANDNGGDLNDGDLNGADDLTINDFCCPFGTLVSGGAWCQGGYRLRETRQNITFTNCWRISCVDRFPSTEGIGFVVIQCR